MKTVVLMKDGCEVGRLELGDDVKVQTFKKGEPTPIPDDEMSESTEPQTYDWEHVKRTPGVWKQADDDSGMRVVTLPYNGCQTTNFYIVLHKGWAGKDSIMATAISYWESRQFTIAPERLEDMRIMFGGGPGEEGAALATKIHHVLCHYSAIADSDIVELLQKCKKFIEAKCRL